MSRLIDAEKLPLEPKEANQFIPYEYASGWNDMLLNVLKAEQIDAVPVVRCQDCKNHSDADGKHYCKFWRMYCPDDSYFFCKAGKRKESADNEP